jgi:GNAT superfamily N-acetyltransferase
MATIRRAGPPDIPLLVSLRSEFLAELRRNAHAGAPTTSPVNLEASTAEYFSRAIPSGQYAAWLAEEAGVPVGMVGCLFFERPPMERPGALLEGRVVNVYTRPEWRGRGIGGLLLRELTEHARLRGARRLRLGATADACPLYTRLGFLPVATEMELRL